MEFKDKLKELFSKKPVEIKGPFKDESLIKKIHSPLTIKFLKFNRFIAVGLFIVHLFIGAGLILNGEPFLSLAFFLTDYILISYLKHTKK